MLLALFVIICGGGYYAYSSHKEKQIDTFRDYVLRYSQESHVYREIKRRELGLSPSEAAAVIAEAQAIKAFNDR